MNLLTTRSSCATMFLAHELVSKIGSRIGSHPSQLRSKVITRKMARALITTSFPSTTEVARKLGVSASRIQHVQRLMDLNGNDANGGKSNRIRIPASKRRRAPNARKVSR